MPALRNQRQERFCQLVKQGIPPYRAYPAAGYSAHHDSPYRLRENAGVKRRLAELTKGMAMKTRVTVESLTDEFNDAISLAKETKNAPAITQAAIAKGKLHGLMVDRKETGAPGDFAGLNSADDVLALVREQLGEEATALLVAALARRDEPSPVQPAPAETSPGSGTIN